MFLNGMQVPIITYHSIDESGSVISTTLEMFRRQMKQLSEAGFEALTLSELVSGIKGTGDLPDKPVVLTFDDGFRNFKTEAFPVLNEYDFKATVFIVTDFCGGHNDWSGNPDDFPRTELLSWDEIRELDGHGVEFGSHTRTHQDLTKLNASEVKTEIVGSKKAISDKLGREAKTFAYPFGHGSVAVRRVAKDNFDAACSTKLGKVRANSDIIFLKRIDAYYLKNHRLMEMLSSATFDNYMRFRQAARNVKTFLGRG